MRFELKTKGFHLEIGEKSKDLIRDKSGEIIGCNKNSFYDIAMPYVASDNFITLFESLPEVSFPIRYIIDKIQKGNFLLKSQKDDSIIWNNDKINLFLTQPNPLQTFSELISSHFAYKFATGNSFIKAAKPDTLRGSIWKWCDNYWVMPSNCVQVIPNRPTILFSSAKRQDIIKSYRFTFNGTVDDINPENVLHVRELNINSGRDFLLGRSRLISQLKPISNLIPVYEARNVIYVKRGALGMIVSKKKDETGSVALSPAEKKEIIEEYEKTYGVNNGQHPTAIIRDEVDYIKTNMNIQELMPFEETLLDAISIASAFSIPSQLVPRKDNSTYDNQENAEKSVYMNIVIPEAKSFVRDFTRFTGLDKDGMYLDVDFSDVDVLQKGNNEKQKTLGIITNKCKSEFLSGVITLNDWRAQIGESMINIPIYNKLVINMTSEEISKLKELNIIGQAKSTNNGAV